ncbi:hypothetical protein Tco_0065678 [Tanacetum coccineum]
MGVKTMEQYLSKTRADYRSGVTRPKIDEKSPFELKGQFLKELRQNTFSGSDNEDANEHIEKVLKILDLFHVPNITEVILFYNGLDIPTRQILDSRGVVPTKTAADAKRPQIAVPKKTKDCLQKEEGKALEEAYYTQFGGPFQGGGYRATAPGYYQRNNANPSFQERRQYMEETLSKFMNESAKREENSI